MHARSPLTEYKCPSLNTRIVYWIRLEDVGNVRKVFSVLSKRSIQTDFLPSGNTEGSPHRTSIELLGYNDRIYLTDTATANI